MKGLMKSFVSNARTRGPGLGRRAPCPKVTRHICKTDGGADRGCGAVWGAWQFIMDGDKIVSVLVKKNTKHDHDWPQFLIDSQNMIANCDILHLWNIQDYCLHQVAQTVFKILHVVHLPAVFHPSCVVNLSDPAHMVSDVVAGPSRGVKRSASPRPIYRPAKMPRAARVYQLDRMNPVPDEERVASLNDSIVAQVPSSPRPLVACPSSVVSVPDGEALTSTVRSHEDLQQQLAAALGQLPALQRLVDVDQVPA